MSMISARLSSAIFLWSLAGCGSPRGRSLDSEVREYIRLAVALGERDPDALDYYYGPADWVADVRRSPPPLPQIKRSAEAASARLTGLRLSEARDRSRQHFLLGQLRAIAARADLLLGVTRTFDEENLAFFGIRGAPAAGGNAEAVRSELARLLPGQGTLAHRYEAFDAQFSIEPNRISAVMTGAIQACREQTTAHLKLPPGERVTVEYVNDKPWSAYSYYRGNYRSVIQINAGLGLTVDRALELACHEGYPGHHVFNMLTDEQLVRASNRLELLVQPTFSPQSLLSEAAATIASDLAFSEDERIRVEREELFPIAGLKGDEAAHYVRVQRLVDALHPVELSIARSYLDGKLEFARAAAALEDQALMAHTDATLRYLNEYRTYVTTYTEGQDQVRSWIDARPNGRWAAFRELIAHPDLFVPR